MIWKQAVNIKQINAFSANTMVEHLGIEFTENGENYLVAKMPVDSRTVQPFRLLHGGASVALAETIGSTASMLCIDNIEKQVPVGVEINANHLRSVTKGFVFANCKPIKIGRTLHIWAIEIKNEEDKLVCVSRLTIAIIERKH